MIPKVIHYCWFGRNPLPELAVKCIESWKRYLPDYEIKEWNEDNFDVNSIPYTREAYTAKKYAFVSDYARFYILYHHGGLYFDTDVEVIRTMDDIILQGAFMGCESDAGSILGAAALAVNPGLGLGCNSGLVLYAEVLSMYEGLHFLCADGKLNLRTVVQYTTELLVKHGLKNVNEVQQCADVWIYPKEYFCPIDYYTGQCKMSPNTHTIHHYAASWVSPSLRLKNKIIKLLGKRMTNWFVKLKNLLVKKR